MSAQVHTYQFNVEMTCKGCSGALTKVLEKTKNPKEGEVPEVKLTDYTVVLESKLVTVTGPFEYDAAKKLVGRTNKTVTNGEEIKTPE